MVAAHGAFYATEPNSQQIGRITLDGQIKRVIDLSKMLVPPDGWKGATGITSHGTLYFGTLGTFPVVPGTENVYKLTQNGNIQNVASGLTAVLAVAFDEQGRLYVLEDDTVAGFPGPAALGTGQVIRVDHDGKVDTVATGLSFPTGMAFGPDGRLYVSNLGYGAPAGAGQIVVINTCGSHYDYQNQDFSGGSHEDSISGLSTVEAKVTE